MIKDIIVHLDGSADDAVRILHAERIAASFGAHIRGLYANILPEVPLAMAEDATVAPAVAASQDEARTNGDLIEQALTRALAGAMPFLERAQEVVVAMVDRDGPADAKGAEPGADIARHLDRHSV